MDSEVMDSEMMDSDYSLLLFQLKNERARNFMLTRRVKAADRTLRIPVYLYELADKIVREFHILVFICFIEDFLLIVIIAYILFAFTD